MERRLRGGWGGGGDPLPPQATFLQETIEKWWPCRLPFHPWNPYTLVQNETYFKALSLIDIQEFNKQMSTQ